WGLVPFTLLAAGAVIVTVAGAAITGTHRTGAGTGVSLDSAWNPQALLAEDAPKRPATTHAAASARTPAKPRREKARKVPTPGRRRPRTRVGRRADAERAHSGPRERRGRRGRDPVRGGLLRRSERAPLRRRVGRAGPRRARAARALRALEGRVRADALERAAR